MKKAVLNWSTGKDAAFALYKVKQEAKFDVVHLITTVNKGVERVSMHGIRETLLKRQIEGLGLAVKMVYLEEQLSMTDYEYQMKVFYKEVSQAGIGYSIFGDILLKDLKLHREKQLAAVGIQAVFPLWNQPTLVLIQEMIDSGLKAIVVCVNENYLGKEFLGRTIDAQFVKDLPANVDPCGENGEFHTFVYDGPNFKHPIAFERGESVYKTYDIKVETENGVEVKKYGYWFLDLK